MFHDTTAQDLQPLAVIQHLQQHKHFPKLNYPGLGENLLFHDTTAQHLQLLAVIQHLQQHKRFPYLKPTAPLGVSDLNLQDLDLH